MPHPGTPGFDAQNTAFNNYFEEINSKGMFKAGDPVQASSTSKTVRVRNGQTQATDGPFNKTGDQLVGFYVIEPADLDEPVKYAAKCPVAFAGAMAVRPLLQFHCFHAGRAPHPTPL